MLKLLQPPLEDAIALGRSYEPTFDRFELFMALAYADLDEPSGHVWGPIGRFGWKYCNRLTREGNPFLELKKEAERHQDGWPPLQAGLFGGSYKRFNGIATGFEEDVLKRLHWF
jgi:hypothetical protein